MTAPALITLAHGSRDPRSAATIASLTELVRCMRPDLRVEESFLELSDPSPLTVADRLVAEGFDEIVVIPLLLTQAYHANVDVPQVLEAIRQRHPHVSVIATDVLGIHKSFLGVLDLRLRAALREARATELDALVLASAGSSDPLANAHVARVARAWGARHKLPVLAAFASTAPPATGEAVRQLRNDGKRHIAVGSLFLAPGFLPDRAAVLALEAVAVPVSDPLGASPELAHVILARYAVGAVDLVPIPV
ncbi:sirohydrochlorin chelatase [Mumia xiangluensis]|uniref:Sirohydrochlorin chelatase n=1 Tax=Mumia xiangluensis TaxID=1678900 RepID=A0ABW1QMR7_9ACTN